MVAVWRAPLTALWALVMWLHAAAGDVLSRSLRGQLGTMEREKTRLCADPNFFLDHRVLEINLDVENHKDNPVGT